MYSESSVLGNCMFLMDRRILGFYVTFASSSQPTIHGKPTLHPLLQTTLPANALKTIAVLPKQETRLVIWIRRMQSSHFSTSIQRLGEYNARETLPIAVLLQTFHTVVKASLEEGKKSIDLVRYLWLMGP
jgi:hypothetical protein